MICKFEGCEKRINRRNTHGYCREHRYLSPVYSSYMRQMSQKQRDENPKAPLATCLRICSAEGCDKVLQDRNKSGFCRSHTHLSNRAKASTKTAEAKDRENRRRRELSRKKRALRILDICQAEGCDNEIKPGLGFCATHRHFRENHKADSRKSQHVRRARQRDAFVEDVDLFSLWCRDSGLCFLCGFPADKDDWWLAHIIPLARGGEHSYANTAVSHPACNRFQNDRLVEEIDMEEFLLRNEEVLQ